MGGFTLDEGVHGVWLCLCRSCISAELSPPPVPPPSVSQPTSQLAYPTGFKYPSSQPLYNEGMCDTRYYFNLRIKVFLVMIGSSEDRTQY